MMYCALKSYPVLRTYRIQLCGRPLSSPLALNISLGPHCCLANHTVLPLEQVWEGPHFFRGTLTCPLSPSARSCSNTAPLLKQSSHFLSDHICSSFLSVPREYVPFIVISQVKLLASPSTDSSVSRAKAKDFINLFI